MFTLLVVLLGGWCLVMALAPQVVHRIQASGYRNPEAHEPAAWVLVFTRIAGIFCSALVFLVLLPAAIDRDMNPVKDEPAPLQTTDTIFTSPPRTPKCLLDFDACGDGFLEYD
ncbi:hypothetical protein [Nonomuraea sp. NPDC048826]|uniref:hypothetical protein n=1 Tax=Nonomuraea sp. NPDC048826 TaxID=3364347 RepID=UPI003718401C